MTYYFVCPEHGKVFIDRAALPNWAPDHNRLEPVRDDVKKPEAHDKFACPLCGADWTFEYENDER